MKFRLLGSLEVVHDGSPLPIRAARQRAVLAALLVDANRVVPLDVLIARVWTGDPPSRTALHNLIMRLRRSLGPDLIRTRADGYLIEAAESDLDLLRFDALAQRAGATDAPGRVSALLTEALALWRGEPLADVPSEVLHREVVPGLLERRLTAIEQRIEADLALGRHHDLIAELRRLTDRHPLREHFWGQRMRALDGSGRQAEALDCYRQVAKILADELGIDPGAALRETHQRVLTGQAPTPAVTTPTPRQLPARTPHFVGRAEELAALARFRGMAGETVVITAINGSGGIGKTTLAVHWAHENSAEFPDGQLYVDLRGFDGKAEPMNPAEAVRGFLDAFAVPPDRIPAGLDAQAALYRGLLADRRVLVVLDNARDADQVRPLLPAGPTCLALITSGNQLTGLVAREGVRPIPLDLLSTVEATTLLIHHLGQDRVDAEPEAAADLVGYCAGLPLAVALAAARAALDPRLDLRELADDLRDERTRLDVVDTDAPEAGVRAVFSYSYRALSHAAARMFRLLGAHPAPDFSRQAAAVLADLPPDQARRALDELVGASLLARSSPGRFALHDLLRAYAAEQPDDERRTATRRLLDHYLGTALHACALLYPHRVLLGAAALAAETGFDRHAHLIPWTFASHLNNRGHHRDWLWSQRIALAAAERLGDDALAKAHLGAGQACGRLRDNEQALVHARAALDAYGRTGDRVGQASAHSALTWLHRMLRRVPEALRHARLATLLYRAEGQSEGEGRSLNAVGTCLVELGDRELGLGYCERALTLAVEHGTSHDLVVLLGDLGDAHRASGAETRARAAWDRALEIGENLPHSDVEHLRVKLRGS